MLISLNEIKKLVDIKISDSSLLDLIGSRLVEIESVTDLSKQYKNIYIVRVLSAEPIAGTHLSLCKIDAGPDLNSRFDPATPSAVQIVCGAPNVKPDMFAVWIAPGAIVPATASDPEPFEISSRKLRGYISFGMLAGLDELALGDDHSGIVELDPRSNLEPGTPFAAAFDLNDIIIEVENKSLTHRPDCFGLIGFAREVAGILGQPFLEPTLPTLPLKEKSLPVTISSPDLCPAYTFSVINLTDPLSTSPYLTQDAILLSKSGMHSISKIVDITNLYMLKTGQPLHAFDYDKFLTVGRSAEPKIGVRLARAQETLTLLDGKEIALTPSDIVITSADTPVALAGAMGGDSTKITDSTRCVLLESATFSLYNLRKTQMAHGIFSEAITRFTKGQPTVNCQPVLLAATADIVATSKKATADFYSTTFAPTPVRTPILLTAQEINSLLGTAYSVDLIKTTLENVGFTVALSATTEKTTKNSNKAISKANVNSNPNDTLLSITSPAWRTDINIKEDIIEEVGRLLGFDNIPLVFPTRPFLAPTLDPLLALKQKIRTVLSNRLGFNEVLTYSFVSNKLLSASGLDPDSAYKITNSISPDLERFRPSLLPSLLSKLPENLKSGYRNFSLFELNQVSSPALGLTEEHVPALNTNLAFTVFGNYYKIKSAFSALVSTLNLPLTLRPCATSSTFEPKHSVEIYLNGQKLGTLGELQSSILKNFKLSAFAPLSACELTLDPLTAPVIPSTPTTPRTETEPIFSADKSSEIPTFSSPFFQTKFQTVTRDLTLKTPTSTPYSALESAILSALKKEDHLLYTLAPLSIYSKSEGIKHTSFHLTLGAKEKTFTSSELSAIIEKIIKNLSALGAEVV